MPRYTLKVNGQDRVVDVDADMPLLWALRDTLGLTGTKFGCGMSLCGACTVHLDGEAIRSCVTSVSEAARGAITTIEGLSATQKHPVQEAWLGEEVPQCGYCQPGMIMSTAAMLAKNPKATDKEIDATLGAHICRCGTYQRIRRAVHRAARAMTGGPGGAGGAGGGGGANGAGGPGGGR
ncbi:MAG TPA: (2Fe-2S)-binding protein [Patescibacteria group bacterium]|nr:(2Fe-2S)-binding protein [Patescibacteria group bacterium]